MKKSLIIAIALMLFLVGGVFAPKGGSAPAIPHQLNYQGMLTQSDGVTPVTDGLYSIRFSIWDDLTLGSELWNETQSVQVTNGLFNVNLGSITPLGLPFDKYYWLEIKVGADPKLTPRTKLTSVGYAYTAEQAFTALSAPSGGGWVDAGATVSLQTSTDKVGIGTASPASNLHIKGVNWPQVTIDGTSWGSLVMGDYDKGTDLKYFHIRSDGDKFYLGKVNDAFNTWYNQFVMTRDGDVGIGTSDPAQKLSVIGDVGVGSSSQTGSLKVYMSGSANPVIVEQNYSSQGGSIKLYDESGNFTHAMEADAAGSGGFFNVYRSTSAVGFQVDGNYSATNEPRVTINGSARDALFYMDQSGNSSVQLPQDAIYDYEILDEPGVASNKEGVSGITLDGTVQTLLSRTITCPASGYVLVIGTAQAAVSHTTGTISSADFGVSASSSSFPVNQDVSLYFSSGVPTGYFVSPTTVHGLFTASAGSNTFYFLAQENSGTYSVVDMQLTLVYLPTAYGTVVATKIEGESNIPDEQAPKVSSLSLSDIEAERAESEAFNSARIERELAEMRAQIEALKAEMGKQQENR